MTDQNPKHLVLIIWPTYQRLRIKLTALVDRLDDYDERVQAKVRYSDTTIFLTRSKGDSLTLKGIAASSLAEERLRGLEVTEAICHAEISEKLREIAEYRERRTADLPQDWKELLTDLGVYDD